MVSAWSRLVSAVCMAALAAIAFAQAQHAVAAIAGLVALAMVATWLRWHDVPKAARLFNGHDRERAWAVLETVPFRGRFLRRECRIYYHQTRSLCLQKFERWDAAAREAEAALAVAGQRPEAAACHLAAAQSYAHLGDEDAARRHMAAASGMPHNEAVTKGLARVERTRAGVE